MLEVVKLPKDAGFTETASSEGTIPVVLAPKKEGTLRFFIYFRRLNEMVIPDRYTFPRTDDFLYYQGDSQTFTTLEVNSRFWEIPI